MATFKGTSLHETISPTEVSLSVTADPPGSLPSAAADWLYGYGGNDTLIGGGGNDYLHGGGGSDVMQGGLGDDRYVVDNANDIVSEGAGAGTDMIFTYVNYTMPANVEKIFLHGNATTATGNTGANVMAGNALANSLDGWYGSDTLYGYDNNDTLRGNYGNDTLYGGNGDDILYGDAHNDYLDGGAGNDLMYGGTGNDTYIVDSTSDRVFEAADSGHDRVHAYVDHTLEDNVEVLVLFGTAKTGTGNALNNNLAGTTGANILYGLGGDDILSGR